MNAMRYVFPDLLAQAMKLLRRKLVRTISCHALRYARIGSEDFKIDAPVPSVTTSGLSRQRSQLQGQPVAEFGNANLWVAEHAPAEFQASVVFVMASFGGFL
jgi:hypothetical protein